MQIRDIMTRHVETVRPEHVLQEAAGKMKDLNVGSLPVCDNRKLMGMITDRDITIRAVAEGRPARPSLADGLHIQAVMAAAERSSAGGSWVQVDSVLEP